MRDFIGVFVGLVIGFIVSAFIALCNTAPKPQAHTNKYECGMRDVRTGVCTQYDLKEELK